MPSLRPLTDVARTDAKFFGDSVVPAVSAAGFEGTLALLVSDAPDACIGDVVSADVIVEGTQADIEALLAGKQKSELNALDKLKAAKRGPDAASTGVVVRGSLDALRSFVNATATRDKSASGAKDIGAEAGAVPRAKEADGMRLPNGRWVKGRPAGRRTTPAPTPSSASKASSNVVGAQKGGATDRVAFAVQNVAAFVSAGVARIESSGDDHASAWIITAGEARRG